MVSISIYISSRSGAVSVQNVNNGALLQPGLAAMKCGGGGGFLCETGRVLICGWDVGL